MKPGHGSFWFYTLLCLSSFGAFGWYKIQHESGRVDYSSMAEELAIKKIQTINKSVERMTPQDDLSCNCRMDNQSNILSFEKPENCGPDRNYLLDKVKAFQKIDPKGLYVGGRDYSKTADILPRKCVLYIMRKFWKDKALSPAEKREADIEWNRKASKNEQREVKDISKYKPDPRLFSRCDKDPMGKPERYGEKACVTEGYVNLVYNSLIDVADCLDVPPKFIAPKLSNESGLHINAFGMVNDGGIGQFTDQALVDVAQNYERYKSKIDSSSRESCKRLLSIAGAVPSSSKDIVTADANRCHVIATPPNPLRSLIYYGVFYHSTKGNSTRAFERAKDDKDPNFKGVDALLAAAGISSFDKEKMKQMLFVMAYNAGPGRPVVYFREWLKYRLGTIKQYPIQKEDFNMNYWPESAQIQAKAGEERARLMNKKGKPLTLAEYLFVYKDSVYIPAVKVQANMLDKGLGAGTCTENKFLEL